jgi:hypothetical protein
MSENVGWGAAVELVWARLNTMRVHVRTYRNMFERKEQNKNFFTKITQRFFYTKHTKK